MTDKFQKNEPLDIQRKHLEHTTGLAGPKSPKSYQHGIKLRYWAHKDDAAHLKVVVF